MKHFDTDTMTENINEATVPSEKSASKTLTSEQLAEYITQLFIDKMPYNQLLGLKIHRTENGEVEIRLPWQDKLMGNPFQKILHGGVTASILDTIGGLSAVLFAIKNIGETSLVDFQRQMPNAGTTIDMRVDYLRPGKGEEFIATAEVIRKGKKVAVLRMELHNELGDHIAFGTGTYLVG